MYQYDGSPEHDNILAAWFLVLRESGDLDRVFTSDVRSFSSFFRVFEAPNTLVFDVDEQGLRIAFWFQPVLSGQFVSFWIAPRARRSKHTLRKIVAIHQSVFLHAEVLVGTTKQQEKLDIFRKFGYNEVGSIPSLWDGETCYIVSLPREHFYERWVNRRWVAEKAAVGAKQNSENRPSSSPI